MLLKRGATFDVPGTTTTTTIFICHMAGNQKDISPSKLVPKKSITTIIT